MPESGARSVGLVLPGLEPETYPYHEAVALPLSHPGCSPFRLSLALMPGAGARGSGGGGLWVLGRCQSQAVLQASTVE